MTKNVKTLATLASALIEAISAELKEQAQAKEQTATEQNPTKFASPSNSPIMYSVSRSAFGEDDVVSFLVDEVGMELKNSAADYPSSAKMLCMSTDEVRQIMAYCDELKKKAEFGDKVKHSIKMLKGLFK